MGLLAILLPATIHAQQPKIKFRDRLGDSTKVVNTAVKPPRVKGPKALRGELSGGIKLSTDGYAIFVDKGWLKGGENFGQGNRDRFFNVLVLNVELMERKHPKEIRSSGALSGISLQPGSYILGKINNFYTFKVGVGARRLIAGKPDPGTLSIHWTYVSGLALGLIKPYYLNLRSSGETKYADSISRQFISPENIIGRASFSKGFNEIKVVPGFYVKTGLHFDFAPGRKSIMALETGINLEYYTQKIQQMVGQDQSALFFGFYASLQFGKRW